MTDTLASVSVQDLSLRFPIYGADSRSLKKHLARIAIGGRLGQLDNSSTPIVAALSNVSFELRPGDRLALVGPNGSGKTTLLRVLAGVYAPDDGSVRTNGRIASLLDLSLGLDPTATGMENINLRGLVAGLTRAQIRERLQDIAEFSGLGAYLGLPLKTYSSGMMARLAFAVATSVDADILLMDEWIAVGDADFRDSAERRLMSLVEQAHIMVLASHELSLVKSLCNKFMYMDHGMASPVTPIAGLEDYMAQRAAERAAAA
jgi:lipopolysaccharide transport system ATP-binding protein